MSWRQEVFVLHWQPHDLVAHGAANEVCLGKDLANAVLYGEPAHQLIVGETLLDLKPTATVNRGMSLGKYGQPITPYPDDSLFDVPTIVCAECGKEEDHVYCIGWL